MSILNKFAIASTLAAFLNAGGVAIAENGPFQNEAQTPAKDVSVAKLEKDCLEDGLDPCIITYDNVNKAMARVLTEEITKALELMINTAPKRAEYFWGIITKFPMPQSCAEADKLYSNMLELTIAEYIDGIPLFDEEYKPGLRRMFDKAATCIEDISNIFKPFDKEPSAPKEGLFPKTTEFVNEYAPAFRLLAQKL